MASYTRTVAGAQPAATGWLDQEPRHYARGARMLGWLPEMWYERAYTPRALVSAEGTELDQAAADVDLVREARLPQTAAAWGVARFETETGLIPQPEMNLEDRRQRVLGHFRGIGSTLARLHAIANSWNYGEVDIVADPEAFTIYITFIDLSGVPAGIDDHKAEMRANVQAHLDIVWQFRYLLWGDPKRVGTTWGELKATGWTWGQLKTKKPGDLP